MLNTPESFMEEAIMEAKLTFEQGNFPVGAVLVINGTLIDKSRNQLFTESNWVAHAEMNLFIKHSSLIKKRVNEGGSVEVYTTLEPCLMCLGAGALHRVARIIYSCKDNFTGARNIDKNSLPEDYKNLIPELVETDLFKKDSKDLLLQFMNKEENQSHKWNRRRDILENME